MVSSGLRPAPRGPWLCGAHTRGARGGSIARLGPLVLVLLAASCAALPPVFPPVEPPLVWPRAFDPPRFAYVGKISSEADLKRPRSLWRWLGDLVGGEEPPASIQSAHDVAVAPGNVLFVSDPDAHAVHRFDLEHREYRALVDAGGGRRFTTPIGLAAGGGRVFVADRGLGSVSLLSAAGDPQGVLGEEVLQAPVGVATGPATARVYVVDVAAHGIRAFDPGGALVLSFGRRGRAPGEFNYPTFLACDQEERIYVSDSLSSRVQVFDRTGRFLWAFGRRGDTPGDFSQPKGIACDRRGYVYVVDSHFENVQVFTSRGELLLAFGEEGTGPGQFWLPVGIFAGPDDRIWVSDAYNHRVQVFRYLEAANVQETP